MCSNGADGILNIKTATYGRFDRTTCPDPHSRTNSMSNTNCESRIAHEVVRSWCQGKNSCALHIPPSNTPTGRRLRRIDNPCFETYKYLNVTYVCQYQRKYHKFYPLKRLRAVIVALTMFE